MLPNFIAHCDWSADPNKRWMATAVRFGDRWHLGSTEPVGQSSQLLDRLGHRGRLDNRLFIGFDFPIGLPTTYAERTSFRDFQHALAGFGSGEWETWFDVCDDRSQISLHRPFYPYRPGGTKRAHLTDALDVGSIGSLLRTCERATPERPAACCLFWTQGGNQVGKAAISGWQEILKPVLGRYSTGIWPFDGTVPTIFDRARRVIAETYPAGMYGQLGVKRGSGWSKRRQDDRRSLGPNLMDWMSERDLACSQELREEVSSGFGDDASGEDRFDALVGLLGMIDVTEGRRRDGVPLAPDILRWEGWMLGHDMRSQ